MKSINACILGNMRSKELIIYLMGPTEEFHYVRTYGVKLLAVHFNYVTLFQKKLYVLLHFLQQDNPCRI